MVKVAVCRAEKFPQSSVAVNVTVCTSCFTTQSSLKPALKSLVQTHGPLQVSLEAGSGGSDY